MPNVLLIDDDIELCALHQEVLEAEGFGVALAFDGESGVEAVTGSPGDKTGSPGDKTGSPGDKTGSGADKTGSRGDKTGSRSDKTGPAPDIVVLDVMMPGMGGVETLRQIRRSSDVPILMLTARGDDIDRIVGLELGADDYVTKPCTPRELVARLRAILRRVTDRDRPAGALRAGALLVEPAARRASWRGATLDLTSTELNLLEQLVRQAGRVVSREELSERALGRKLTRYDRSIDVHLSHLRTKLGELADGRSPIQTVRGLGYQLIAEPE